MPLQTLWCGKTRVTDLTPLADMPLKDLKFDLRPGLDLAVLRTLRSLEKVNGQSAADFRRQHGPKD
jgi:hypothetical protein